jgi:uncharacterized integral membrane protein
MLTEGNAESSSIAPSSRRRATVDLAVLAALSFLVYVVLSTLHVAAHLYAWGADHQGWQIDHVATLFGVLTVMFAVFATRRWLDLRREMHRRELAESQLHALRGILPICSHCHRIRTEDDEWVTMDRYVRGHSDADFSHGICPDCLTKHYPDMQ